MCTFDAKLILFYVKEGMYYVEFKVLMKNACQSTLFPTRNNSILSPMSIVTSSSVIYIYSIYMYMSFLEDTVLGSGV